MFPTRPPKRLGALLSVLVLMSVWASSCVDAPSAPDVGGGGELVLAPVLSLVGPEGPARSAGQEDALSAAFDLVNRFRLEVRRASDNVVVLDTVVTVTPGADEYDLSVSLAARPDEQFLVTLTALQGNVPLFRAENIPAKATPQGVPGSPPPAAIQIPLVYAGPGATASSVTVGPAQVVLAPGGSATVGSSVRDASGSVVAGVPVGWSSSAPAVATVTASGVVTAVGEGVATVTVTTPTNLSASATIYVATGELAYVEGGALKVRGLVGGTAVEQAGGGASQPAWSPDGARLFYVAGGVVRRAGGGALVEGAWPSVSPDGGKLAVERGGATWFANDDGSHATAGPSGSAPVWADASTLLVGGGSIQRVRADGTGRTTVVAGAAALAALARDGRIASLAGGEVRVTGVGSALVTGAVGRATWSPNGLWLVVGTGSGLVLVPSDGRAPAVALPGLGGATDPAFKPAGALASLPGVTVTGFNPDPPVPGGAVEVLGSGFDWIIPSNNRVVWPVRDATVETAVGQVRAGSIMTVMPRNVVAGQVRVQTRGGSGMMAFVPQFGSLEVTARAPWGAGVAGVGVALSGPGGTYAGSTPASGSLLLDAIVPGTYTATLTAPTGWTLVGQATRSLGIPAAASALALEVVPVVASVRLSPEAPTLAMGQSLSVTLVVTGVDGQTIPQVQGLAWRSLSAELSVTPGSGLGATLGASFAGEGPGTSRLEVTVAGTARTFPVTVTSSIAGTLTLETGATPAPPAPGVTVQVKRGGALVAEAVTGPDGRYAVAGLFRGAYDVAPAAVADLLPVPAGQTVTLDEANPSGRADFRMQSFAGLDVSARTPWSAAVRDVGLTLLDAAGAEAARGVTNTEGRVRFQRLAPGSYTLRTSAPVGFVLTGEASRPLVLLPGNQTLNLEVRPVVQSIRTMPEDVTVPMGSAVEVTLIPTDIFGSVIPGVRPGGWFALSAHVAAGGLGLTGQVGGVRPSAPGEARFGVELDGRIFSFSASVTSHISGTVTAQTPDGTVPAAGILVAVDKDGAVVGETATAPDGTYRVGGLLAGTYSVKAHAPAGKAVTPASRTVTLGAATPTGTANFVITQQGGGGARRPGAIAIYKDYNAWFGENKDESTLQAPPFNLVRNTDYTVHPTSALQTPIPSTTSLVILTSASNGSTPVLGVNHPTAQANLDAWVRGGGWLLAHAGDNVSGNGFLIPGMLGKPDELHTCYGLTLTVADHPLIRGPDGILGTGDDLNNTKIDNGGRFCSDVHGSLAGILPPGAEVLMVEGGGSVRPVYATYAHGAGRVVIHTLTIEFGPHTQQTLTNHFWWTIMSGGAPAAVAPAFLALPAPSFSAVGGALPRTDVIPAGFSPAPIEFSPWTGTTRDPRVRPTGPRAPDGASRRR
jgi:hypothetical protein